LIISSPATRTLIDESAKRGWELFNTQARRNKCHALTETQRDVTFFTDNDFHNIGIGIIRHNVVALARQAAQLIKSGDTAAIDRAAIQTDMSGLGRFLITKKEKDIASFKTTDTRNVLVTGPYFHDGMADELEKSRFNSSAEKAPFNENCAEDHPRKFGKEQNVPSQFYCSSEGYSTSSQTAAKLYVLPGFASTGV
jgi:poly-gamma-glutamate capsule biosynthesis protein CapA/YwtB (metallophosphatase superfamily)